MYRLFDWECLDCREEFEAFVGVPAGEDAPDEVLWKDLEESRCSYCGGVSGASRAQVHVIAKLLADRSFSPLVSGGQFDTAGHKPITPLPEFTGRSYEDFRDFAHSKEYKEVKGIRDNEKAQNKAKRQRTALIKAGHDISIRHNPLPGDPDVTS